MKNHLGGIIVIILILALFMTSGANAESEVMTFDDFSANVPDGAEVQLGAPGSGNVVTVSGSFPDTSQYIITITASPEENMDYSSMAPQNLMATSFVLTEAQITGYMKSGAGIDDLVMRDCSLRELDGVPTLVIDIAFAMDLYTRGIDTVIPMYAVYYVPSDPAFVNYYIMAICYSVDHSEELYSDFVSTIHWKQHTPTDVQQQDILESFYQEAVNLYQTGDYERAYLNFSILRMFGGYQESEEYFESCCSKTGKGTDYEEMLARAQALVDEGSYADAEVLYRYLQFLHVDGAKEKRYECLREMLSE